MIGDINKMKKTIGFIRLMRLDLPFSAGICVLMGQLFAQGASASTSEMVYAFLSIFLISASILALNDYFDVESDRVNAPHRPIPAGIVAPTEALLFSVLLLLAGLLLSWLLRPSAFICSMFLLVIGFLYNRRFKMSGLPGNLMVSFSVGMTFIYGAISIGQPFNSTVWFFAVIAALIDLGEEISADAMDMAGDRLIQSRSLAICHGRNFALRISAGLFLSVIVLTAIPFFLGWFTPVYLLPIAIMDGMIAWSALRLLKSDDRSGRMHIRQLYMGATAGLLLFLVMRLCGV
jgi:geranylgeranylglycerol-phosphate geranylgeranyltransferase